MQKLAFVFVALVSITAIDAATVGSCIVDSSYYYCIEYKDGYSDRKARKNCSFANGEFRSGACPAANRQGACKIFNKKYSFTHWNKYYKKTWTQMSYKSQQTSCDMWNGKYNTATWIKADPDNPSVQPFKPAS